MFKCCNCGQFLKFKVAPGEDAGADRGIWPPSSEAKQNGDCSQFTPKENVRHFLRRQLDTMMHRAMGDMSVNHRRYQSITDIINQSVTSLSVRPLMKSHQMKMKNFPIHEDCFCWFYCRRSALSLPWVWPLTSTLETILSSSTNLGPTLTSIRTIAVHPQEHWGPRDRVKGTGRTRGTNRQRRISLRRSLTGVWVSSGLNAEWDLSAFSAVCVCVCAWVLDTDPLQAPQDWRSEKAACDPPTMNVIKKDFGVLVHPRPHTTTPHSSLIGRTSNGVKEAYGRVASPRGFPVTTFKQTIVLLQNW